MLQVIFSQILSPELFNSGTVFGAASILTLNVIWILSKVYIARKKHEGEVKQTAQDHLHEHYHRFIDELQDTINQLMEANSALRQELIDKMQKLIEENARYKTKLDYLEDNSRFIASTVKDIKVNGNGHKEKNQPELPNQ